MRTGRRTSPLSQPELDGCRWPPTLPIWQMLEARWQAVSTSMATKSGAGIGAEKGRGELRGSTSRANSDEGGWEFPEASPLFP